MQPLSRTLVWVFGLAAATPMLNAARAPAAPLPPEFWNGFKSCGSLCAVANDFEIVYAGNQTSVIPAQTLSPLTDAFNSPNPITVAFDPIAGNTVVTFSGAPDPFVLPGQTEPHFGLNNGQQPTPPLHFVSEFYTTSGASNGELPAPTVFRGLAPPPSGTYDFAVVFMNEGANGDYTEIPFEVGGALDLSVGNFTDIPITLSKVEYFISPSQIPLDDLNEANLPPTDPRFMPGIIPNGTVLAPGQTASVVPEPGSSTLLVAGILALLGWRRRVGKPE